MDEVLARLLEGAIDSLIHIAPDPRRGRIADAHEVATEAKKIGMRGLVFKSNDYPTAPLADLVRKTVHGIEVFGALSLNEAVGGVNPRAVEASAKLGARVVWMPTHSSLWDRKMDGLQGGVPILGQDGRVLPEVREVLNLVKEFDLVLGAGHISTREILALFDESRRVGVSKFVVNHPLRVSGDAFPLQLQKEVTASGAFIEHCLVSTMPKSGNLAPEKIAEAVHYVGAERCFLSTDLGQLFNPPPWEGMRLMVNTFLRCGLSERELTILIKENPRRLLNC